MPIFEHGQPFTEYTVAILGQGPSIVPSEADRISRIFPTIAIKDTYKFAPRAVIIYACDRSWWKNRNAERELLAHEAVKVVLDYQRLDPKIPDLLYVKCGGNEGFNFNPGYVCHGRNSGHQAINLAVNMGARKIILLGFDMKAVKKDGKILTHFEGCPHVKVPVSVFDDFRATIIPASRLLVKRGIRVVNTCLDSAIDCFPKMPLDQAIEWGKYA